MTGKNKKDKSKGKTKSSGTDTSEKDAKSGESKTYVCITCDKVFEVEPEEKPRCPTCMSIHSVEPYRRKGVKVSKQNLRLAAILGGLIVAAVGIYFFMDYKYKGGPSEASSKYNLTFEELKKALEEKGIGSEDAFDPFKSGEALKAFVEKTAGGGSAKEKGEKLYNSFLEFKNKGGFVSFVSRQARKQEPMSAGDVFAAIKKNEKVALYSLELATMFVKAARIAGLNAAVAKVDDYKGMDAPLDPSGNVGHFAAAVYDSSDYQGKASIYDLHQGKIFPSDAAIFSPLSDVQVVASYFGHEALYLSGIKFDSTKALAKIEDAIGLFASSAELHSLKGLIYIGSGGVDEGKQQIRKALTIKKDAPRVLKWGAILLAEGELEQAIEEIRKAIDMKSRYALAHATLAMALLAMGETDQAKEALELAKEIDPNDPLIPFYEANYYMERGQVTKAIEYAEKAFEKSDGDPQVGIMLASLYESAGERKKMASVLDQVLANENLPDELEMSLMERFGYDPDDEFEDEELEDDLALDFGGLPEKGGLLSSSGPSLGSPPSLGVKPSLGNDEDEEDEELDEEEDPYQLKLGTSKGGLLTGKGSGLDLELR